VTPFLEVILDRIKRGKKKKGTLYILLSACKINKYKVDTSFLLCLSTKDDSCLKVEEKKSLSSFLFKMILKT
jgi:hypothetical protein